MGGAARPLPDLHEVKRRLTSSRSGAREALWARNEHMATEEEATAAVTVMEAIMVGGGEEGATERCLEASVKGKVGTMEERGLAACFGGFLEALKESFMPTAGFLQGRTDLLQSFAGKPNRAREEQESHNR